MALAWQLEQDSTCRGCGLPLEETTDPDSEGRYEAEKIRCFACQTRGHRAEPAENDDRHGLLFPVHRAD